MDFSTYMPSPKAVKKKLKVVIGIFHKQKIKIKSAINETLEKVQMDLKKELNNKNYDGIEVAFVYETPALEIREFEEFKKDSPIIYKEPCGESKESHNMAHIFFMGCSLIERDKEREMKQTEYRMYIVADSDFDKVQENMIFQKDMSDGKKIIKLHPRYAELNFKLELFIHNEEDRNETMSTYIEQQNIR